MWRGGRGKWYGDFVKVRDVIRMVEQEGWYRVVTEGSHRQYRHATKPGQVTIHGHPRDDMPQGTLAAIWRQAALVRGKKS